MLDESFFNITQRVLVSELSKEAQVVVNNITRSKDLRRGPLTKVENLLSEQIYTQSWMKGTLNNPIKLYPFLRSLSPFISYCPVLCFLLLLTPSLTNFKTLPEHES